MREIKFRGKSKNLNEWCYGTYIFTDDNRNNPFRTEPLKGFHRIVFWCSGDWNTWVAEEVVPETIGQYTGLKDKNGKEIYEGDIIGCYHREIKHLIFYNEKQGRFMAAFNGDMENDYTNLCGLDDSRWNASKEVIGNIHDNPELIKKEEK